MNQNFCPVTDFKKFNKFIFTMYFLNSIIFIKSISLNHCIKKTLYDFGKSRMSLVVQIFLNENTEFHDTKKAKTFAKNTCPFIVI